MCSIVVGCFPQGCCVLHRGGMCSIQEGCAPQGSVLSMGRVFSMRKLFSTEGSVGSLERALAQRAHNGVEARN